MALPRAHALIAFVLLSSVLVLAAACGDGPVMPGTHTPGPTPTAPPGTPTAEPTPADPTPAPGAPAAPSDVTVSGRIPDLTEPVPPGEGEAGRILVEWTDNADDEDGFRIWTEECEQPLAIIAETQADETSYGPINPCRPARVGVSAFNDAGDSEIVWAE